MTVWMLLINQGICGSPLVWYGPQKGSCFFVKQKWSMARCDGCTSPMLWSENVHVIIEWVRHGNAWKTFVLAVPWSIDWQKWTSRIAEAGSKWCPPRLQAVLWSTWITHGTGLPTWLVESSTLDTTSSQVQITLHWRFCLHSSQK